MSGDLVPYVAPDLSPEVAEQRAVAIRAAIDQRADAATIREWLVLIGATVARPRPTQDDIAVMIAGMLDDDVYPTAVFNQATRSAARRAFKFWPSAAEIWDLLRPHIEAMGGELPGLDRIVRNARRAPIVPAREAFGYLDSVLATGSACVPPEVTPRRRPLRELGDVDRVTRDDPEEVKEEDAAAREWARKQLVALGVAPAAKPEPDRPAHARIATVNDAPIPAPEPSRLPPVRRRRTRGKESPP
jgi:hypothetical protein